MTTALLLLFFVLFVVVCCDETRHYLLSKVKNKKVYKLDEKETSILKELVNIEENHYMSTKEIAETLNLSTLDCKLALIKMLKTYKVLVATEDFRGDNKVTVYKVNDFGLLQYSNNT